MHPHRGDLSYVAQPAPRPRPAGIRRFVHPAPNRHVAADLRRSRAHVHYIRIRNRYLHRADRGHREIVVGNILPAVARVRRLPHAAARRPHVKGVGLRRHARHRRHPAAPHRTDHAVFHSRPESRFVASRIGREQAQRRCHTCRRGENDGRFAHFQLPPVVMDHHIVTAPGAGFLIISAASRFTREAMAPEIGPYSTGSSPPKRPFPLRCMRK